jgi:hypothetical protein
LLAGSAATAARPRAASRAACLCIPQSATVESLESVPGSLCCSSIQAAMSLTSVASQQQRCIATLRCMLSFETCDGAPGVHRQGTEGSRRGSPVRPACRSSLEVRVSRPDGLQQQLITYETHLEPTTYPGSPRGSGASGRHEQGWQHPGRSIADILDWIFTTQQCMGAGLCAGGQPAEPPSMLGA